MAINPFWLVLFQVKYTIVCLNARFELFQCPVGRKDSMRRRKKIPLEISWISLNFNQWRSPHFKHLSSLLLGWNIFQESDLARIGVFAFDRKLGRCTVSFELYVRSFVLQLSYLTFATYFNFLDLLYNINCRSVYFWPIKMYHRLYNWYFAQRNQT